MNVKELKARMILMDKSADDICAAIGISRTSWFRKTCGHSQFTQGEIAAMRRVLKLDDAMTSSIFFSEEVSQKTQRKGKSQWQTTTNPFT